MMPAWWHLLRAMVWVLSAFMSLMKKLLGMESIISMNFPVSLPLFVGHYLLQSLEGTCEVLRCGVVLQTLDICICLVWWWSSGEVKMDMTESAAVFSVAAQCIQVFRAKVQGDLVCLWGGSLQICSWCVCGGKGIRSKGVIVVMSAMWMRGQGVAFGLFVAVLASEPAVIPACWSIGLSVASNCLPWWLQTKKLKIAI